MSFNQFKLHTRVLAAVPSSFTVPTPIQSEAIPQVLAGSDLLGLAQTGTGKTAAFVLPMLSRLIEGKRGVTRGLIVAPTRELAEQIRTCVEELAAQSGLSVCCIYGGVNISGQIRRLRRGVDIIVACPGRLLDHIERKTVDLRNLEMLVLDEADQMFDMGFLPTVRKVLKVLPPKRQSLLFSATMPKEVEGLAREILNNPVTVQVGHRAPATTVSHAVYPVDQSRKADLLLEVLKESGSGSVLIFTRTKHRAKKLGDVLVERGYKAASLQGNLSQQRRQAALNGFRSGRYQVLVATDIAARGIDVESVTHVINFDIPSTVDAYTHRIGRTGRAERTGDAVTFVSPEDESMVRSIERVLGAEIERKTKQGFTREPGRSQQFSRERSNGRNGNNRSRGRSYGSQRSSDSGPKSQKRYGGYRNFGRNSNRSSMRDASTQRS